jgi:transposase
LARRKIGQAAPPSPCDPGSLAASKDIIEIHRPPPYSPEFNPVEGCWKATRREATHNRYYATTDERDAALVATLARFRSDPARVSGHVRRFQGARATA